MNFMSGVPVKEETLEVRVPRDLLLLVKSKKVQPAVSDEGGDRVQVAASVSVEEGETPRLEIVQ
jgi:hypothetical protein